MTLQRKLLRAMLALLGLAALAGVSTIFVQATDLLWRIALTLIAAAFAIALALPASRRLEHESTRNSGLAALVAIIPAFLLVLLAIWVGLFGFRRWEWHFAGTAGHYAICASAALGALALARRPGNRASGTTAFIVSCLCFAIGFVGIWIEPAGLGFDIAAQFWATAWLVFWCGIITSACLYGLGTRTAPWRWLGVASALIALAFGFWGIWNKLSDPPTWFLQALFTGAAIGICNVLNTLDLKGIQRIVALGTVAMILASFFFASYINISTTGFKTFDYEQDFAGRLLAASSIVSICGLLAIVIFLAANRRALVTHSGTIKEIKDVRIICPRCATKCDAHVGTSRCSDCGLLFLLQLAEPRCIKCEYNLLDLKADRCPECGTPVSESTPAAPAILA